MDVAVIGVGLMGGSIGLAARRRGLALRVRAYARREETRRLALERGAADACFASPGEAAAGADLVVLCTPVLAIPALVRQCLPRLKPGCVVTDVGSTKGYLHGELDPLFAGSACGFVGSHPVAGSEQDGIDAARADLYEGAAVVVTATPGSASRAQVEAVARFWRSLGAEVIESSAAEHDLALARASHMPHLAAAAVAACALRARTPLLPQVLGPGFRDTTRIAGGEPGMWRDIVETNAPAVAAELRELGRAVQALAESIEAGRFEDVRRFLADARDRRRGALGA